MRSETKTTHITPAGSNVFDDLGFGLKKAAELQAESQRIIADKLAARQVEPDVGGGAASPGHMDDPA